MKFLGLEFTQDHKRSDIDAVSDKWYKSIFEVLHPTSSGQRVTPDTALRLTAVSNAVRLLSEAAASLPIHLYRRYPDDRRELVTDHMLNPRLTLKPNKWQTRFEFVEMMMIHMLLRGNAYAQIVPSRDGTISQLVPLHPDRVEVKVTDRGRIQYHFMREDGTRRVFPWSQILHVRNMSLDGLVGLSAIELAREAMGMSLAAEEYGARFFANDSTPGGVLVHPNRLDEKVHKRVKDSWRSAHAGVKNAREIAILEEGMKFEPISINAKDAQFIEARQFQVEEIARVFNLPPHMLKDLRRATFSNIEDQDLAFLKYSLRPWLVRWQQALVRDLVMLVDDVENLDFEYFIEFDTSSLTEADMKTRNEGFATGIQNGYYSVNDVRRKINLNPIEYGDIHLAPLNMIPLDRLPDFPFNGQSPDDSKDDKKSDGKSDAEEDERQLRQTFTRVMREPFRRLTTKERKEIWRQALREDAQDAIDKFYIKHEKLVFDTLREIGNAYVAYRNVIKGLPETEDATKGVAVAAKKYCQWARGQTRDNLREWSERKSYDDVITTFLITIEDFTNAS